MLFVRKELSYIFLLYTDFGTNQMLLKVVLCLFSFGGRGLSDQFTKYLVQLRSEVRSINLMQK